MFLLYQVEKNPHITAIATIVMAKQSLLRGAGQAQALSSIGNVLFLYVMPFLSQVQMMF